LCQHTIVALLAASAGKLDGFFRNDESLNESLPQIQKLITEAMALCPASLEEVETTLDLKSAPKDAILKALDSLLPASHSSS